MRACAPAVDSRFHVARPRPPPPPKPAGLAGDTVTNPINLGSAGVAALAGSTAGMHQDYMGSCSEAAAPDVVYLWTPPSAGTLSVSVCPSGAFDSLLFVRGASSGAELGCRDDGAVVGCSNQRGSQLAG